jgi:hypothetical protein
MSCTCCGVSHCLAAALYRDCEGRGLAEAFYHVGGARQLSNYKNGIAAIPLRVFCARS